MARKKLTQRRRGKTAAERAGARQQQVTQPAAQPAPQELATNTPKRAAMYVHCQLLNRRLDMAYTGLMEHQKGLLADTNAKQLLFNVLPNNDISTVMLLRRTLSDIKNHGQLSAPGYAARLMVEFIYIAVECQQWEIAKTLTESSIEYIFHAGSNATEFLKKSRRCEISIIDLLIAALNKVTLSVDMAGEDKAVPIGHLANALLFVCTAIFQHFSKIGKYYPLRDHLHKLANKCVGVKLVRALVDTLAEQTPPPDEKKSAVEEEIEGAEKAEGDTSLIENNFDYSIPEAAHVRSISLGAIQADNFSEGHCQYLNAFMTRILEEYNQPKYFAQPQLQALGLELALYTDENNFSRHFFLFIRYGSHEIMERFIALDPSILAMIEPTTMKNTLVYAARYARMEMFQVLLSHFPNSDIDSCALRVLAASEFNVDPDVTLLCRTLFTNPVEHSQTLEMGDARSVIDMVTPEEERRYQQLSRATDFSHTILVVDEKMAEINNLIRILNEATEVIRDYGTSVPIAAQTLASKLVEARPFIREPRGKFSLPFIISKVIDGEAALMVLKKMLLPNEAASGSAITDRTGEDAQFIISASQGEICNVQFSESQRSLLNSWMTILVDEYGQSKYAKDIEIRNLCLDIELIETPPSFSRLLFLFIAHGDASHMDKLLRLYPAIFEMVDPQIKQNALIHAARFASQEMMISMLDYYFSDSRLNPHLLLGEGGAGQDFLAAARENPNPRMANFCKERITAWLGYDAGDQLITHPSNIFPEGSPLMDNMVKLALPTYQKNLLQTGKVLLAELLRLEGQQKQYLVDRCSQFGSFSLANVVMSLILRGTPAEIRALNAHGVNFTTIVKPRFGINPLCSAVHFATNENVTALLEAVTDESLRKSLAADIYQSSGKTILHFAAENTDQSVMTTILPLCDPEILLQKDHAGNLAIHTALEQQRITQVIALIRHALTLDDNGKIARELLSTENKRHVSVLTATRHHDLINRALKFDVVEFCGGATEEKASDEADVGEAAKASGEPAAEDSQQDIRATVEEIVESLVQGVEQKELEEQKAREKLAQKKREAQERRKRKQERQAEDRAKRREQQEKNRQVLAATQGHGGAFLDFLNGDKKKRSRRKKGASASASAEAGGATVAKAGAAQPSRANSNPATSAVAKPGRGNTAAVAVAATPAESQAKQAAGTAGSSALAESDSPYFRLMRGLPPLRRGPESREPKLELSAAGSAAPAVEEGLSQVEGAASDSGGVSPPSAGVSASEPSPRPSETAEPPAKGSASEGASAATEPTQQGEKKSDAADELANAEKPHPGAVSFLLENTSSLAHYFVLAGNLEKLGKLLIDYPGSANFPDQYGNTIIDNALLKFDESIIACLRQNAPQLFNDEVDERVRQRRQELVVQQQPAPPPPSVPPQMQQPMLPPNTQPAAMPCQPPMPPGVPTQIGALPPQHAPPYMQQPQPAVQPQVPGQPPMQLYQDANGQVFWAQPPGASPPQQMMPPGAGGPPYS